MSQQQVLEATTELNHPQKHKINSQQSVKDLTLGYKVIAN